MLVSLSAAALVALSLLAITAAAVWRSAHTDEASRIDHVDVVIVLGAAQYAGRPSPVFEARLRHGELLFDRGFSDRVLVVGAGQPGDVTTEADAGRRWLLDHGLPDGQVFAAPHGTTTFESLQSAARFMRAHDLRTAFLVSDPWHNLRVRRMARDLGITAYVSATWYSAARSHWTRLSGYTRETFAYLYYRVLGR